MTGLTLDAALCRAVIEGALDALTRFYVFPETAAAMEAAIRERMEAGAYDGIRTGDELRDMLTSDLRAICADRHLRLVYHPEAQPPRASAFADQDWLASYWTASAFDNHGLYRAERLPGNVGYIDLRAIDEAEYTAPTIAAAMALLCHTSALIIDLRANNGGAPSGVAFFCSYFFPPEPVHVNSVYTRPSDSTQQFWTSAYLPGPRYLDRPVFVLTSSQTFSGAEELAYNLQALGRATIVGETTGGGAHPIDIYQIHPHFDIRVPVARSINPITGTNWEGSGIKPDIAVPQAEALHVAQVAALRAIIERHGDDPSGPVQRLVAEARDVLRTLEVES